MRFNLYMYNILCIINACRQWQLTICGNLLLVCPHFCHSHFVMLLYVFSAHTIKAIWFHSWSHLTARSDRDNGLTSQLFRFHQQRSQKATKDLKMHTKRNNKVQIQIKKKNFKTGKETCEQAQPNFYAQYTPHLTI